MDGRVWEALHVAHALARSGEFDLVHNHLDWLPAVLRPSFGAPLVTTIHGFSAPGILPAYRRAASAFVSISDSDRAPDLDYVATVHHGVDVEPASFSARAERTSCRSGGPPRQGDGGGDRHRAAGRAAPGHLRDRPRPAVLRRARSPLTSTGRGGVPRLRRSAGAGAGAW